MSVEAPVPPSYANPNASGHTSPSHSSLNSHQSFNTTVPAPGPAPRLSINGPQSTPSTPPSEPVNSSTPPAIRTFPEALHDQFDRVYQRVTFGRRDLKTIRAYFEARADTERQYAARLIKDAGGCAELAESSSAIPAWKDVKECSIQLGTHHNQLGSLCSELANQLEKVIRELKQNKTILQRDYVKITDDCKQKQIKHDKAREAYANSVKAAEAAIQQRDASRNLPPQKQQQMETQVQRSLTALNGKHEEYKKSVDVLNASQSHYDTQIIEIMAAMERHETERLRVLNEILNRFANQHDVLQNGIIALTQQLHRSTASINNPKDIQDYIQAVTANSKVRDHVQYHAIQSGIIEQNGVRASGGVPPQQMHAAPSTMVAPQAPPPYQPQQQMMPQQQQQYPPQQQQLMQGQPPMQQQYPPVQQQQHQLQQQSVVQHIAGPISSHQNAIPVGVGGAKFIPPPVAGPFVPPSVNAVGASPLATALYDFDSAEPDDLTFKAGDTIILKAYDESEEWWTGELRGRTGIFPKTYVQKQPATSAVPTTVDNNAAASHADPGAPKPNSAALTAAPVTGYMQQPDYHPTPMTPPVPSHEGVPNPPAANNSADPAAASAATAVSNGPVDQNGVPGAVAEQPREMHARCEALFDFIGQDADELSFNKGASLIITGELNGWYLGKIEGSQQVGIFPSNYVSLL